VYFYIFAWYNFWGTLPTRFDKREVAAKNDAMYYVPEILRQLNMMKGILF